MFAGHRPQTIVLVHVIVSLFSVAAHQVHTSVARAEELIIPIETGTAKHGGFGVGAYPV